MSVKLRILCIVAALCVLGSIACFSGYAVEVLAQPSGDEEYADPGVTDPVVVDPGVTDPVITDPVIPDPVVPDNSTVYVDPVYSDPGYYEESNYDPGYTESSYYESETPSEDYPATYSDLISEGNYPQADVSSYIDYTSQYIANTYSATYDDNYYYVPSYTEPAQSLIAASEEEIDTDELSADDWKSIMLDLEAGNITDGTKTFNFIKNNEEEGDTSIAWMLYLGMGLIMLAVFIVIYVIISTKKANRSARKYRTA